MQDIREEQCRIREDLRALRSLWNSDRERTKKKTFLNIREDAKIHGSNRYTKTKNKEKDNVETISLLHVQSEMERGTEARNGEIDPTE